MTLEEVVEVAARYGLTLVPTNRIRVLWAEYPIADYDLLRYPEDIKEHIHRALCDTLAHELRDTVKVEEVPREKDEDPMWNMRRFRAQLKVIV